MKHELYTGIDGFPDFVLTNRGEVRNVVLGEPIAPDEDGVVRVVTADGMLALHPMREALRAFGRGECAFDVTLVDRHTSQRVEPYAGDRVDTSEMTYELAERVRADARTMTLGQLAVKYGRDRSYWSKVVRRILWK